MSNATHGGKGDKQRPTDQQKYAQNYDAIFNKNKQPASQLPQSNIGSQKPHKK